MSRGREVDSGSEKLNSRGDLRVISETPSSHQYLRTQHHLRVLIQFYQIFIEANYGMASLLGTNAARSPNILAKRKRKTFSCLECRRRKLRCDRSQPSCSRCRTQESACTYAFPPDSEPPRSESDKHSGPGRDLPTPTSSHTIATPPHGRNPNIEATRDPVLQATQSQGTWGLLSDQAATNLITHERPAIMSDTQQLLEPEQPPKKENVIFRGKNFRTQYYGGSNPTSLIGDVCCLNTLSIMIIANAF